MREVTLRTTWCSCQMLYTSPAIMAETLGMAQTLVHDGGVDPKDKVPATYEKPCLRSR